MQLSGYFEVLRLTIQFQEYKSKTDFIINHPWRLFLLASYKFLRRFHNYLNRHAINKLVVSNKPSGSYTDDTFLRLKKENNNYQFLIEDVNCSSEELKDNSGIISLSLNTGNSKVIFIHAFYHDEAIYIYDKLSTFTDYDIIITSPHIEILNEARKRFGTDRVIGFITPNHGRDVMPFLMSLKFLELHNYTHFVKLHTKKSKHLRDKGRWFKLNIEFLIGNKAVTDRLFSLMQDDAPKIFGESVLEIHDHLENNIHWLSYLLADDPTRIHSKFVPGTMFLGTGSFLRLVKAMNLQRYKIEKEAGQLDGCCVHALERYFGYLASKHSGCCKSIENFIKDEETVL